MRRFEYAEGTSNKFWEIVANGPELKIRFGKLGSDGQTKLKKLATAAAAADEMAKLIAEKTKKGYREAGKNGATNGVAAAKPAPRQSTVDPAKLALKELKVNTGGVHRIAIADRFAITTGNRCTVSSDGKSFHRRADPGTSYGLEIIDGAIYTCGGPFCVSRDRGATWKEIKVPFDGYRFAIAKDASGTWWLGCDGGVVLTSKQSDKGWKKASFKTPGKVLQISELDGKLALVGAGSGTWDGKKLRPFKGLKKTDVITRLTESPAGTLIAVGDGGVAFRSTDRGASFQPVKSGVKDDLEDCAWVAGALFVVGGGGTLLRSTNDGKSFQKVKTGTQYKIWSITSWGDGALLGGDDGKLRTLTGAGDTYWRGATDDFAPPPIAIDPAFQPHAARSADEREKTYARLYKEALEAHEARSTKQRASRKPDANAKLAAEIDEGGDDAMAVYADWLSDQGDPRGELAQVQLRLAKDPKNKELKKTEKALLSKHADVLLGKLAPVMDVLELEWRAGFIYKARIANTFERSSMHDGEKEELDIEEVLGWLLDEPSARFLRELVVGIITYDDNDYSGTAALIGKRYLPSLRSLFLGDFHSEETELNWSHLGRLEPMYAALPNLVSLTIRSGSMQVGSIVLPKLEKLEVITGGLDAKSAKQIAAAKCPGLRSLTVQVGSPNYDATATQKDLAPILDGAAFPRLEHLGLTNNEFTDALIEPLATSKLLPQLTSLSLALGTLGDDGVATMVRLQRAFAHLESIELDDNYISSAGKKELAKAKLPVHLGDQRDDDGEPEDRYCAAGE